MRYIHLFALLIVPSAALLADNVVHPATPVLDRPTITALGVQLPITGDDNFNAAVAVSYRVTGTSTWRTGLPLFRVHPESVVGRTVHPQFAGSILDLKPATSYDIQLHVTDPDGPVSQTFYLTAATRAVPADPASPRVINVSTNSDLLNALRAAKPGDVINAGAGIYPGPFYFFGSGTALNPIVIRGASQSGTIFDGGNCPGCNIWEIYGSYVHLERLTIRNGQRAIRYQQSGTQGNVVRGVHVMNVVQGIYLRPDQLDYYIADNIVEGRLTWPLVTGSDNGAHSTDDGIVVMGQGHVVCHNRISGFADALQNAEDGDRAIDFYNNDVLWTYDNGVELDGAEGNIRCLRNRFTNGWDVISLQPIYGGPAYVLRNLVVNAANEQLKFHGLNLNPPPEPSGILVYHNTLLSTATDLNMNVPQASHHFELENNLFLGPATLPGKAVSWSGIIDDGRFDYNGYYPDGWMIFNVAGLGYRNYPNFAAVQAGGLFEKHGALLPGLPFASHITMPSTYTTLVHPLDLSLASGSAALNKGRVLPNVNDGYTGSAPDWGALELQCPKPIYGPRPAGIDEHNEPIGCRD